MPIFQTGYQIAAGHNNAAGLATLEGTTVSGTVPFMVFRVYSRYSPGVVKVRGSGLQSTQGYPSVEWHFPPEGGVFPAHDAHLSSTYCSNGRRGLVTVRTTLERISTFANFNAILVLPEHREMSYTPAGTWADYTLTFFLLEAAS